MDIRGRVLIVAGSDSGGGAGIQADIKAVTALGGYAMTAITALTAQNTLGVAGIEPVAPAFVAAQMRAVLEDIGVDCLKLGMLHSAETIEAVADVIDQLAPAVPLVLDPVMVAKGGALLLDPAAVTSLKRRLLSRATVVTPNIPEAEVLAALAITSMADRRAAATRLLGMGATAVLLKGGHADDDPVTDLLATASGRAEMTAPRLPGRHTHGTGCTLASALAAGLAQGLALAPAVERARRYLFAAMRSAPGFGAGHGPLNHAVTVAPLAEIG